MFDFKKLTLNPFKTRVGKKIGFTVGGLIVVFAAFHIADTYFNKGPAEDNLRRHIETLHGYTPYRVSCANVDTGNYDSRVTCEALLKENDTETKLYLCKGMLDGLSDDCFKKTLVTGKK